MMKWMLAMSIFVKSCVNINSKSSSSGKTLLDIVIKKNTINAGVRISTLKLFNFKLTGNNNHHIFRLLIESMQFIIVFYHLLQRINENVLSLWAGTVDAFLICCDISSKQKDSFALIDEVKQLILEPFWGRVL